MRTVACWIACVLLMLSYGSALAQRPAKRDADVARGRYLVMIAGCNDCHTADYAEKAGAVPEALWLTGSPVGFQGGWGTTYPSNLRLAIGAMTEAQWMKGARQALKPPMPWFALRDMTDADLRAIYRYVKSLGPAGIAMPPYAAPGVKVTTPVIVFP